MAATNQNFIYASNISLTADGSTVINYTDLTFEADRPVTQQPYGGTSETIPIYGVKTYSANFTAHQVFSNDISVNEVGYDYFYDKWLNNTEMSIMFKTSKSGSKYMGGKAKIGNISLSISAGDTPNSYTGSLQMYDVSVYTL